MGTICIIIGVVIFALFAGGGYFAVDYLASLPVFMNMGLFTAANTMIVVGVFAVIGLIFGLNWVVLGINCKQIRKLKRRRKKKLAAE